jgi:hypothetical protein
MADGEKLHRTYGLGFVDQILEVLHCDGFQHVPALAGGIADVQDNIRDGVEIKLPHFGRQGQLPLAVSNARVLEGQIPLVLQVRLK